jgi:hypothetical protein
MFYYKKKSIFFLFPSLFFLKQFFSTQSFLITSQIKRAGKRTKYTKPKQKSDFKRDSYANFRWNFLSFFFRVLCLIRINFLKRIYVSIFNFSLGNSLNFFLCKMIKNKIKWVSKSPFYWAIYSNELS